MSADPNATSVRGDHPPSVVAPAQAAGGRYALGEEIARGGMGAVYRATDTILGREVAVKVLQERFAPDGGTARRFADEARIAAQLQHPGIPPVHDFGTLPDGRPFLAMKLIRGETLDARLAQRPDPSADRGRFVAAFEAVCQAVAYAHARDVIHRDLKPANVMVGRFGEVQVMDWGLAKVLRPGSASDGTVRDPDATAPNTEVRSLRDTPDEFTQAGSAMGTPAYMPPEQAVGAVNKVGPWSDVFGLGAILAVILTGKPPFAADTAETTRVKAAQGDVADCFARLDSCGAEPDLIALCKRCLAPKPADRLPDAGEVAAAAAYFRTEAEARARQAELDRVKAESELATAEILAVEQRKQRLVLLQLAMAVVLLVAGAGGVAVWRVDENGRKHAEAQRLEGEDRERKQRGADAVAALLDQGKDALAAEDAGRAAGLLDRAARRAADDGTDAHAARLAEYRRELSVLRELEGVYDFRWDLINSQYYPSPELMAGRWAGAFARSGIEPGTTPPTAVAARVNGSVVRTALVAGLDGWLAQSRSAAVREFLSAADPEPFRDEIRRRLAAGDAAGLGELEGREEWGAQPSGLVQAYCDAPRTPPQSARALLLRLAVARRTDFRLLMQLGSTYAMNTPDTAGSRARWYQAAVALRPGHVGALVGLGYAMSLKGEQDTALAAFREAARLDPKSAPPHIGLGSVLLGYKRDPGAALAAFREAVRLDPESPAAHNNLGNALATLKEFAAAVAAQREAIRLDPSSAGLHFNLGVILQHMGEVDAAVAAYREAIRLDPAFAPPHLNMGILIAEKGELGAAVAAFREAVRLDPKSTVAHYGLGLACASRFELDEAGVAFRECVRLDPRLVAAHANLGTVYCKLGRHADAVAAYRAALAIQPTLGAARDGLDYCLRVLRGEVPTAPPPRAVSR